MDGEPLIYEKRENLALLTLNRPERRNALNTGLVRALRQAWDDFESDPDLRVAVLTARGKAFCAGMDLEDPRVGPILNSCVPNVGVEVTKPVIAAINGSAVGVGFTVAMHCDIKVISEGASLIFPEAKVGIAQGGVDLLKFVPYAIAMELWLTGEPLGARRAYELGIVNRVVPEEAVMDEALKFAHRISQNAPLTLKMLKMFAVEHTTTVKSAWLRMESRYIQPQLESEDLKEGARAFKEKRKPVFKGE
jgi:enoyl-CoA hydratase